MANTLSDIITAEKNYCFCQKNFAKFGNNKPFFFKEDGFVLRGLHVLIPVLEKIFASETL